MDAFMPLFLLTLWAHARSEPLPDVIQRRSGSGVYAKDYTRDYEPITYAAVPLHAPIPVQYLQIMPFGSRREPYRPASSAQRPIYALPPQQFDRYSPQYRYAQPFAGTVNYVMYSDEDGEESAAPTILYARPTPTGGYTYRRKPTKKRNPPKKPTEEPILIRVHKYRIIRDR